MRVRTQAKRQAIVDIAGSMFLRHGYAQVSMAAVAAEVGGSKGTLYGYFPSKADLFAAFVVQAGEDAFAPLMDVIDKEQDAANTLKALGMNYLRLLLRPKIIAITRLVVSEAGRATDLSAMYFDIGPRRVLDRFIEVFEAMKISGKLVPPDSAKAAREFKALCEAGLYEPVLLGIAGIPSDSDMEANVAATVDIICSRYGPTRSRRQPTTPTKQPPTTHAARRKLPPEDDPLDQQNDPLTEKAHRDSFYRTSNISST
ncbi:TetR/AcrR family transcriptional regulator [Agrobacterium vitis]|uniref:TetR/AcrR family transcriptional regulator n=1 Tax=Agrobacterium vitis TaxID=373 RepID=UPI002035B4CF|nr:TetR/AcrR family transcriptional regulator [Agrobacterium vitis]MCM2452548.1 TetR/AcrR family transcriptional regulator [Agrobacterium vitis]